MPPVNYPAILVCAVVYMIIGALWYSPLLFAKPWMKALGKTEGELKEMQKSGMVSRYLIAFISALVVAFAMAVIIGGWNIVRIVGGIKLGLVAGIGISAASWLPMFVFEQRSFKLFLIDALYSVAAMTVMGIILVAWK